MIKVRQRILMLFHISAVNLYGRIPSPGNGKIQNFCVALMNGLNEERIPSPRTNGEGQIYGWWRPVAPGGAWWRPVAPLVLVRPLGTALISEGWRSDGEKELSFPSDRWSAPLSFITDRHTSKELFNASEKEPLAGGSEHQKNNLLGKRM